MRFAVALALLLVVPALARAEVFTVEARLRHASHPPPDRQPSVVVQGSVGLAATEKLDLVFFLHGWRGCARALALSGPVTCERRSAARPGWGLFERHAATGSRAILVIPQLAWLARSGRAGRFRRPGFFRRMVVELLTETLRPHIGARTLNDVRSITLIAHSAGYESALAILRRGDLPVKHVVLLDALYAGVGEFARWVAQAPPEARSRLVSLHTRRGSPRRHSRTLVRLLTDRVGAARIANQPTSLPTAMQRYAVVVDRATAEHGQIPRAQWHEIIAGLRLIPPP